MRCCKVIRAVAWNILPHSILFVNFNLTTPCAAGAAGSRQGNTEYMCGCDCHAHVALVSMCAAHNCSIVLCY
jgi:hypothetical protein